MSTELMDQSTFQAVMMIAGGAVSLVQVLLVFILRGMATSQREISKNLKDLNDLVLSRYVTNEELEVLEKYVRRGLSDVSDHVQYHEVSMHLLAKHVNMELPAKPPIPPR